MMLIPITAVIALLYFITKENNSCDCKDNSGFSRCYKCGCILQDDYIYCPNCSEKLKKKCEKCGKIIDEAWRKCPFCE